MNEQKLKECPWCKGSVIDKGNGTVFHASETHCPIGGHFDKERWNSRPESGSVGSVPSVDDLDDAVDQSEKTWMLSGAAKLGPKSTFIAERLHALLSTAHQGEVPCTRCGDPIKVGVCENCVPEIGQPKEDAHRGEVNSGGCPVCHSPEVDSMTPRTVYACGSSDYDQRPGTFRKGEACTTTVQPKEVSREAILEQLKKWRAQVMRARTLDDGNLITLVEFIYALHLSPAPGVAEAVEHIKFWSPYLESAIERQDRKASDYALSEIRRALSSLGVK